MYGLRTVMYNVWTEDCNVWTENVMRRRKRGRRSGGRG